MSNVPVSDAVEPEALDIQHDTDPAQDHGIARRIPHLGHAALFFLLAFFMVNVCVLVVFSTLHLKLEAVEKHPGYALVSQALAYALTLAISAVVFPRFWQRPFVQGIHWNALAARRRWYWMVLIGAAVSAVSQTALHFIPTPETTPFDGLIQTQHGAWLLAAFAVLLAPATEEIAFRGFLLPALATAYDWLSLERTPAGLRMWENSTAHSVSALVFSAIFSSVPFALLHASQLSDAWGPLGILYGVSLILSVVRIRTHSVACSTLVHATYNFSIFVVIFVSTGGFRHLEKLNH
jgi:membrane protease YdiL (CAAX protease family)